MLSMKKYKISIVIAMYNIQDYILECLESCANQEGVTPDDYEVIIVSDGSTDKSAEIASEFARTHHNFWVLHKENGGLSDARNAGLAKVRGEYVWFVDGDDRIARNAISILKKEITGNIPEALIINFSTFEVSEIIQTSDFKLPRNMCGRHIHNVELKTLPMMAWLTIYSVDYLNANNLRFLKGILHEDKEFSIRAHHLAEKIMFCNNALYQYRINQKCSIMSEVRRDNTKSLISEIEIIKSFHNFFEYENTIFKKRLLGVCALSFLIRRYDSAFVYNDTTKRLLKDYKFKLYKLMWQSRQMKRRLLLIFIILMPKLVIAKVLYKLGERSKLM